MTPMAAFAASRHCFEHEAIAPEAPESAPSVVIGEDKSNQDSVRTAIVGDRLRSIARQAAMDPDDGMAL